MHQSFGNPGCSYLVTFSPKCVLVAMAQLSDLCSVPDVSNLHGPGCPSELQAALM